MQKQSELVARIGKQLREAREEQRYSLAQVATALHRTQAQIAALEAGDEARLPEQVYVVGIIRSYSKLLGVEVESGLLVSESSIGAPKCLGRLVSRQS